MCLFFLNQRIPNNIKSSIISVSPEDVSMSGSFVANTTAIKQVFQRISAQFAKMFKRKAFLHWYTGEGMDQGEFEESDKNVRDLVTEYQDKQDVVVNIDDPFQEEEPKPSAKETTEKRAAPKATVNDGADDDDNEI
ncbi:hypothetical protein RFI_24704 [Reticulomyxa filosa]|uniref:Tubulin/FtsZ 2-layer sandwich domain-containing protein n=1 Tax=Reticulomyxa filosa TaxID=46433 RepID=X6MFI5_RETFI|nr:hypothetical protein RFI_24704 [Reticulomyxa filosa]|eukprot:ETO12669.1 hypothetical protein RFI_24704 [Reticulomyxa filosa]